MPVPPHTSHSRSPIWATGIFIRKWNPSRPAPPHYLAAARHPLASASATWLGLDSPKQKIHQAGLWIVNELFKQPLSEEEFAELVRCCGR